MDGWVNNTLDSRYLFHTRALLRILLFRLEHFLYHKSHSQRGLVVQELCVLKFGLCLNLGL